MNNITVTTKNGVTSTYVMDESNKTPMGYANKDLFTGEISFVQVWDKELTAEEIKTLYNTYMSMSKDMSMYGEASIEIVNPQINEPYFGADV